MTKKLSKIISLLSSLAFFAIVSVWYLHDNSLPILGQEQSEVGAEAVFMDVGQGDAALILTPSGKKILVDGGDGKAVLERMAAHMKWNDNMIDIMILSHPHADHLVGQIHVMDKYEVGKIYYTGVVHSSPDFTEWLTKIRDLNLEMELVEQPKSIDLGSDGRIDFLFPYSSLNGKEVTNINNSSLVFKYTYGEVSYLFTGDIELETEEKMLTYPEWLAADVLKVSHHGSDTSTSQPWLEAVMPSYAVISVGADNSFGHPSQRVISRLERLGTQVLRTDQSGDIDVFTNGREIMVK